MIIAAVAVLNLWEQGEWMQRQSALETIASIAAAATALWFLAWRLKRSRALVAD